jgi:hypothetical protein
MKEKLKTFLLISLFGLSIIFTKKLWIQLPSEIFSIFTNQNQAIGSSYLLSDMIAPNKYLVNFNEKNHTLFYDDSKYGLWTNTKRNLTSIFGSKDIKVEEISKDEFSTYNGKRSIVFYFPEKINTYILARALDVKKPNFIVDTIPTIDKIYIYLGNGDPFFVFSYEDKNIVIHDQNIDISKFKEQLQLIDEEEKYNRYYSMKETMGTDKDIYIPSEINSILPRVYVENEIRTLDEDKKRDLAERFFNKDIDYIREIVESNGSVIYVHNQRVLKLNVNGTLEYFNSLEEVIGKRNLYESMNTAAEFISKHTGVPKGMHLSKTEEIKVKNSLGDKNDSLGYKLTFKYRVRGIPIILGNMEVVDFVEIEVFNSHVRSYKHFIRKDMNINADNTQEERQILPSFYVIDKNYDLILEKYLDKNNINPEEIVIDDIPIEEVISSIDDINLAYFDPCLKDIGDQLIGVWAIRINGSLYAFDVYNGTLVYEKD